MYTPYLRQHTLALTRGRSMALTLVLILGLVALLMVRPPAVPTTAPASVVNLDFGKLPLSFVPNAGQTNPAVRFQVHDLGGTIFFAASEVVLTLPGTAQAAPPVVRLRFEGANPSPAVTGAGRLPGTVNYFVGNDPAKWRINLPIYAGVVYQHLYPGIDLRYDGTSGQLKSTYVVAPGADPTLIRWHHDGATNVRVDEATGDLLVTLAGSTLIEHAPIAWQEINGQRIAVAIRYMLTDDGSVSFALGSYDSTQLLTIDPTLSYGTYLGGSGPEEANDIALDGDGNVYVTGTTYSTDFPITTGSYQSSFRGGKKEVFVAKVNAAGDALVYSTYLGGNGDDEGNGIAVDDAGNAYITGATDSTDFPTKNPLQSGCALFVGVCTGDAFVTKLSADGNALVYSTYLGGSFPEKAKGIAVDSAGNAYITGLTSSADFPTKNSLQDPDDGSGDAFVTKLNAEGSDLVYSTYLGGGATDGGAGIAVDSASNAYVVGNTNSADFPTTAGAFDTTCGTDGDCDSDAGLNPYVDTFVAKLNASGSALVYSTYLGGSNEDYSHDIAVDGAGNAHITGRTESGDFPTTTGALDTTCGTDGDCNPGAGYGKGGDAFVTKLNADGSALLYSTYLGGSGDERGRGIVVNSAGNAYVTGDTYSDDFPTQNTMQTYGGETDAFVVKLEADGSDLVYSTYLGGNSGDYGTGIAVDSAGNAYVTGVTGSEDFPTQNPLQAAYHGYWDAFVVKLEGEVSPPPSPGSNLAGSYKSASKSIVASGDSLEYTIRLYNSGTADATADVVDQLPSEMNYVSSSDGGAYDSGAGTVTWNSVAVPAGGEKLLTIQVTAKTVDSPTTVVNTVTITSGDDTFERQASVLVVPEPISDDVTPPVVNSLTIDDRDVLYDPDVTLYISASDDEAVAKMYLQEWQLMTTPIPHWEIVQSSGWVPYQSEYAWTLESESGTHYVGVWVADEAGNVSHLDRDGLDYASLLLPGETVDQHGLMPYLVYYDQNEDVTATLNTTSGDADLYVWFPDNFGVPDEYSIEAGTATDSVSFTTPRAGTYLFLVYGWEESTYDLSITPGGGPRAWTVSGAQVGPTSKAVSNEVAANDTKTPQFDTEPVLNWSGLDPLADAAAPGKAFVIYLPVVMR